MHYISHYGIKVTALFRWFKKKKCGKYSRIPLAICHGPHFENGCLRLLS